MAQHTRMALKQAPLRKHGPFASSAEEISRVAYQLFERRGSVHGHDLEDWVEAERIVRTRRSASAKNRR